jgi:hypothetical protein
MFNRSIHLQGMLILVTIVLIIECFASDILVKSLSNPHDDLPPDMRMSAQIIVDGEIFLQMTPVKSETSQDSWRLSVDCQMWVSCRCNE